MPTLTFAELRIGEMFVAIKVTPRPVEGERVANQATICRKVTAERAVTAMMFDPLIWSATPTRFDPTYRIIHIIPG